MIVPFATRRDAIASLDFLHPFYLLELSSPVPLEGISLKSCLREKTLSRDRRRRRKTNADGFNFGGAREVFVQRNHRSSALETDVQETKPSAEISTKV